MGPRKRDEAAAAAAAVVAPATFGVGGTTTESRTPRQPPPPPPRSPLQRPAPRDWSNSVVKIIVDREEGVDTSETPGSTGGVTNSARVVGEPNFEDAVQHVDVWNVGEIQKFVDVCVVETGSPAASTNPIFAALASKVVPQLLGILAQIFFKAMTKPEPSLPKLSLVQRKYDAIHQKFGGRTSKRGVKDVVAFVSGREFKTTFDGFVKDMVQTSAQNVISDLPMETETLVRRANKIPNGPSAAHRPGFFHVHSLFTCCSPKARDLEEVLKSIHTTALDTWKTSYAVRFSATGTAGQSASGVVGLVPGRSPSPSPKPEPEPEPVVIVKKEEALPPAFRLQPLKQVLHMHGDEDDGHVECEYVEDMHISTVPRHYIVAGIQEMMSTVNEMVLMLVTQAMEAEVSRRGASAGAGAGLFGAH